MPIQQPPGQAETAAPLLSGPQLAARTQIANTNAKHAIRIEQKMKDEAEAKIRAKEEAEKAAEEAKAAEKA